MMQERLTAALQRATDDLLCARDERFIWTGQLSSSALSTATAISALSLQCERESLEYSDYVAPALKWLMAEQNSDGGWGDTRLSNSNIATTMLVKAAVALAQCENQFAEQLRPADSYIDARGGIDGLRKRYGRDKTFAVPILANAALAGQVPWNEVSRLPFELACLPQSWYRFLQLPVVSYAIPALVAVGQAIHHARKPANPLTRWLRTVAIEPSLRVLGRIQPASGGYLEAVPLTSFVAMSLASCGRAEHPVTKKCIEFIKNSMRADASWPIDTNLATWNTTLALNALGGAAGKTGLAPGEHTAAIEWVLSCQNTAPHPFTGAAPGGWGWSDLSGAVPDADDTPGALLALRSYCDLPERDAAVAQAAGVAATHGVRWLLDLQNRDGGWPTFCRGWGKLPFDRSGTDLTAHALRALHVWRQVLPQEIDLAAERGWSYLARYQNADGSWTPLWFGNQYHPQEENPIYGTSKCLLAYRDCARMKTQPAQTALDWLIGEQNDDGGWGGDGSASSMEETSLATEAVIAAAAESMRSEIAESAWSGVNWLISAIECDQHRRASPIGLYFAKLWYYESTYPLAFTASALRAAKSSLLPLDAERCVRNQSDATHSQARGCEFGNR